jgi:hypothetical protein
MGGGRIIRRSLRTTGNKNCFKPRPNFFLKIIYDPFIFAKNSFSTGMALCVDLGQKCPKLFPLV